MEKKSFHLFTKFNLNFYSFCKFSKKIKLLKKIWKGKISLYGIVHKNDSQHNQNF